MNFLNICLAALIACLAASPLCKAVDYRNQKLYVNSIPKSGTHLLLKCLKLLTGRETINISSALDEEYELPGNPDNSIFYFHANYTPHAIQELEKNGYKGLFIYRDPRDQLVSNYYWILRPEHKNLHNFYCNTYCSDLLITLITQIKDYYQRYLPWKDLTSFCGVKFENLIGAKGGGSRNHQIMEIQKIAQHIGLPLNDSILDNCIDNLYGETITFREGKIGSWKNVFTEEHKNYFKEKAGDLLITLGYETDLNW